MKILWRAVMWFAVAGFLASAVLHLLALAGVPSPLGDATMAMHIGAIFACMPAMLASRKLINGARQQDFWGAALRGCEPWMRKALAGLVGYAAVNFVLWIARSGGSAGRLSDASELRGFSGHWMVFYALAAALLYSAIHTDDAGPRVCPRGHDVSAFAKYCDTCGARMPDRPASIG